jgi:cation diffusion facilitator family transporter
MESQQPLIAAESDEVLTRRKRGVALLSVVSNTSLVAGKLAIGLLIGSVSVISEAIHSAVDLVAAVIAYLAVRSSGQPADPRHPFGHGKLENLSGVAEAVLIFVAAAWIIYEAIEKLIHPTKIETLGIGVLIMAVSAVVNLLVSRMLFKVGRETDSMALIADAWHLRTDVWTSAGVTIGLGVIMVGGRVAPGLDLDWVDPVVAILVALLIVHAAWKLTLGAVRDLMDESLPDDEIAWIRSKILGYSEVRSLHRLRTRKAGPNRFIDFHLVVNPEMTVLDSHTLGEQIASDIKSHFAGSNVIVHVEPCDDDCSDACLSGCQLPEKQAHTDRLA